jgi:hypothetical protein
MQNAGFNALGTSADASYDSIVGRNPDAYLAGLLERREALHADGDPRTRTYGYAIADLLHHHPTAALSLAPAKLFETRELLHDHFLTVGTEVTARYIEQVRVGNSSPATPETDTDYINAQRAEVNVSRTLDMILTGAMAQ